MGSGSICPCKDTLEKYWELSSLTQLEVQLPYLCRLWEMSMTLLSSSHPGLFPERAYWSISRKISEVPSWTGRAGVYASC